MSQHNLCVEKLITLTLQNNLDNFRHSLQQYHNVLETCKQLNPYVEDNEMFQKKYNIMEAITKLTNALLEMIEEEKRQLLKKQINLSATLTPPPHTMSSAMTSPGTTTDTANARTESVSATQSVEPNTQQSQRPSQQHSQQPSQQLSSVPMQQTTPAISRNNNLRTGDVPVMMEPTFDERRGPDDFDSILDYVTKKPSMTLSEEETSMQLNDDYARLRYHMEKRRREFQEQESKKINHIELNSISEDCEQEEQEEQEQQINIPSDSDEEMPDLIDNTVDNTTQNGTPVTDYKLTSIIREEVVEDSVHDNLDLAELAAEGYELDVAYDIDDFLTQKQENEQPKEKPVEIFDPAADRPVEHVEPPKMSNPLLRLDPPDRKKKLREIYNQARESMTTLYGNTKPELLDLLIDQEADRLLKLYIQ